MQNIIQRHRQELHDFNKSFGSAPSFEELVKIVGRQYQELIDHVETGESIVRALLDQLEGYERSDDLECIAAESATFGSICAREANDKLTLRSKARCFLEDLSRAPVDSAVMCAPGVLLSEQEYFDALELMKSTGGSFVRNLGTAWMVADQSNRVALEMAFGDLLCQYARSAKEIKGK